MAEMYLNGKGEPTGSDDLNAHAQRIKDSRRDAFEQAELDLIWHDEGK